MSGTTSGVKFDNVGLDTHMSVYQGTTISFEITWGGSAPIDVTGYQATLQIRDRDNNLLLEMSTANGKVTVGGADGKFTFSGTAADSRSVDRVGVWALELITPGGDVYRALSGNVSPVAEVVT